MTLAQQIKKSRTDQKLTLDFVKTKAGISLDTLRRYEKGKVKNPSLFTIRAIEKALNTNFDI